MSDPKSDAKTEQAASAAKAADSAAEAAAKEADAASASTGKEATDEGGMKLEAFDDAAAMAAADQAVEEGFDTLKAELDEVRGQLMRAAADVQNTRRRAERDRREAELYGGTKLARDVLTVYDNLAKALGMVTDDMRSQHSAFIEGLELVQRELLIAFGKHQIKPVDPAKGEKFDPNLHQAMFESPVGEPGTVVEVMQQGFTISERLLRPAMVGVASATAKPAEGDASGATAEKDKTGAA